MEITESLPERASSLPERASSLPEEASSKTLGETDKVIQERPRSEIEFNEATQTRSRMLTAKGSAYVVDKMKRNRALAGAAMRRKITNIYRLLEESNEIFDIENQRDELDLLREKLDDAHNIYYSNLKDSKEIDEAYNWFDLRDGEYFQCRSRISEVIKTQEQMKLQYHNSERSSLSKSSRSSRSSTSSVRSRRAKAAAKAASLQIEMDFIDQEAEFKRQQMLKEIAKAKAEEKTMRKFEEEFSGRETISKHHDNVIEAKDNASKPRVMKSTESNPRENEQSLWGVDPSVHHESYDISPKVSNSWQAPPDPGQQSRNNKTTEVNVHAEAFIPLAMRNNPAALTSTREVKIGSASETNIDGKDPDSSKDQDENNTVAPILIQLAKLQLLNSLPKQQPPVFCGNVFDYPYFINAFDSLIEAKVDDPKQRLYYLNQFTSGVAREVIKGFVTLNSPDAYTKARSVMRERFGHPYRVAQAYKEKITNWVSIKDSGDGASLQKLSDFLMQTEEAMRTIQHLEVLNNEDIIKKICSKLPNFSIARWCRRANDIHSSSNLVNFHDLVKFVKEEADFATNPVFSPYVIKEEKKADRKYESKEQDTRKWKKQEYSSSFLTQLGSQSPSTKSPEARRCIMCMKEHSLENCQKFKEMHLKERTDFIRKKELCFGCFGIGHVSRRCMNRKKCDVCNLKHPTLLHDATKGSAKKECSTQTLTDIISNCLTVCNDTECSHDSIESMNSSMILPVWLYHEEDPDRSIIVYALLDPASNGTFIKKDILMKLGRKGVDVNLRLNTMHGSEVIETQKVAGLKIEDLKRTSKIDLPKAVYCRDDIPSNRREIPCPAMAERWKHLSKLTKQLPLYQENAEIGLLIGSNCPKAIKPHDVIPGNENDPYAIRTLLGWGIIGPVSKIDSESPSQNEMSCNRIVVKEIASQMKPSGVFVPESRVKELIDPSAIAKLFELDFNERCDVLLKHFSMDDQKFLTKVSDGVRLTNSGHYEIPLPFREDDVKLPDNRRLAVYRVQQLKSRFERDKKYKEDYVAFMDKMITKGHAVRVPADEESTEDGKCWYIPHHGVYHPKKPGKIRVVFDCSSQYKGESINKHLLQGPDLTNKLVGVLTRFRQEPVAFTTDIEGMFHQVQVTKECRDFLRFLWWPNGETSKEIETYKMTVHLFGAASSPGCSNFALKRTAEDNEREIGNEAAEFLRKNFYVDDGLKSVSSVSKAVTLIKQAKEMCSRGGFNLCKFISNRREVLQQIPEEDRADSVKYLDLDVLPIERTLGVQWCIETDSFEFRIVLQDRPLTRRGILSTVCSIYDPLGFLAPIILTGKRILQDLCHDQIDWDEEIPEILKMKWEKWRIELPCLRELSIPRCFKSEEFGEVKSAEIHNFSDASNVGYSQCSYLRLKDTEGKIHCSLVMGKARVTPLKTVSIPRLELTAALVAVKVSDLMKSELEYNIEKEVFWTDSQITLGYIGNDSKRFHVYVANRVSQIRSKTRKEQWNFIDSSSNPADDGSRGMTAKQLLKKDRWIRGPNFLWQSEEEWPQPIGIEDISIDDVEVKRSCFSVSVERIWCLVKAIEVFSTWQRARLAVANCLVYRSKLLNRTKSTQSQVGLCNNNSKITVEDLKMADIEIYKSLQMIHFEKDVQALKIDGKNEGEDSNRGSVMVPKHSVKKSSQLYRLNPFCDSSGILRVGGRIKHACVEYDAKFPIILPRHSHVTELIIRYYHERVAHQGRGLTLNEIRSNGLWIIGGSSAVASLIRKCVTCRRLRGIAQEQLMADLPEDRFEEAAPFTYAAVDYCGPWYIKERRKELKRYVALFTCMATRAIHLEISNTMDTDSFIQALRRFLCRRGPVRQLRSDRGSNFIGAQRELREALKEMDDEKIRVELLKSNCDWIEFRMNVPKASHFGGVWERQIRTVRSVLNALMRKNSTCLDDESFHTLICEVESIVNSRPLTVDNLNDPESLSPLTPNHLLTMKSKILLPPPGIFQTNEKYSRRRWRRIQHFANEFWARWRKEFLHSLQERTKWNKIRRNLQIGDIVLLMDESEIRNNWKLGRIIGVNPDETELVRSVKLVVGDALLNDKGQRTRDQTVLERPIHKLVLLVPNDSV